MLHRVICYFSLLLPVLGVLCALCIVQPLTAEESQHQTAENSPLPNIVFAIADDWGWPHAGSYGDRVVQTPNFDRVATRGVLFTHAYVSSPSCTPSRSAIITGQDFFRLGAAANLHSDWPTGRHGEYPAILEKSGYFVGTYRKSWGPGNGQPAGQAYKSVDSFFAHRPKGKPFCFWFGASDPHRDYQAGTGKARGMDLDAVHLFGHYPDHETVRSDVADYYYEVERFDRELGELLDRLAKMGELENTLVVVTGDHGMPFPRCKANLYDSGVHVPLAISWPAKVPAGRVIDDFVCLTDVAPTFLAAAGLSRVPEMTGRSLLPLLESTKSGWVESQRDHVVVGRERHVPAQESGNPGGYPARALRTKDYLYIRNFAPDRWPAGTPDHMAAYVDNGWLGDCDNSPTKTYLWQHRDDPAVKAKYDLCFAKRPAEELYDLKRDPEQLHNVASDPAFAAERKRLAAELDAELVARRDPRALGGAEAFDKFPYHGGSPRWPFR
ncbi:MAG: sulfatase [Planctomycetota bacterium]|nr:sulfatase [Planctomycetota bacterium]